jgi:uncharacterized membrane protein
MQQEVIDSTAPSWRRVPAGRGVQWWSEAWQLLFNRGAAGVWIGMCVVAGILLLIMQVVPLLGSLAAQVASFIFAGGLMAAARRTDQGERVPFRDLFSGFGPSLGNLMLGALIVMVAILAVYAALALAGLGAAIGAMAGAFGGVLSGGVGLFGLLTAIGIASLLLLLGFLVLLTPILMAEWLAPALIMLRRQAPMDALKSSLAACWGNLGALTVYGLLGIVFAIIATFITVGLGWLLLMPLAALSTYCAFRDLFGQA